MVNPQIEEGHTKIANEIMDHFCKFRIPGELRQVVDAIVRKTYGWNKKQDRVSNSQIVEMTGMKKQNVWRALSELFAHKIVIRSDYQKSSEVITSDKVIKSDYSLCLNKNYEEWISFGKSSEVITKKSSSEVITPVIRSDYKSSSEVMPTKDNKDTTKDKREIKREKILTCTEEQIWKTAVDLRVSKYDVERTYREILRSIEEGDKYKVKNAPMTLVRWVQRGLRQGDIEQISDLEYMGLKHDTPARLKFVAEIAQKRLTQEEEEYANGHKQQV